MPKFGCVLEASGLRWGSYVTNARRTRPVLSSVLSWDPLSCRTLASGLPPLIPDSRQKWNSGSKGCLFDWQTVPFGGVIRSTR
jgi:hypothetical protein